ncbi:MAG: hypothetical protein WD737_02665 [Gemmatimonadota bacterium]
MTDRVVIGGLLLSLVSCGLRTADEPRGLNAYPDPEAGLLATVEPRCVLPSDPTTIVEDGGLVLKVWRFLLEEVHAQPVLPDEAGLLVYRATIHAEGTHERYPALYVPTPNDGDAEVWRDENFNNNLAYREGVGSIEPISCLDALLFAEQNARVPQLERPTEFLASVLVNRLGERNEVVVVFGAGTELFPPSSVHGFEIVDEYVAAGWQYRYVLHNHTRQTNGALGVPVPSTSDVDFARRLAAQRGLESIRVTNGFYSFDATIAEISDFRGR